MDDDNQYFKYTRDSDTYTRSYVLKILPLSMTILSFASPADGLNIPYVTLFYQTHSNVSESATIQSHGNAKRTNATSKPFY